MRHRIDTGCLCVLCVAIGALPRTLHSQEHAGEIAVSDEAVDLRYIQSLTRTGTEVGFGLFWDESRDLVISGNYYFDAEKLRFARLSLAFGPVAYAAMLNTENVDVFSIALGAEATFELLPRQDIDIVVEAAYAPDILTFGAADRLWDITGRVRLPLTDRITAFAGYRLFEIDLLEGRSELEDGIHVGMRYRF